MSGRYYRALSIMHQQVQEEINTVERSPLPDWVRVNQLKRMRLSIKDRMKGILKNDRELSPERPGARDVGRQGQRASFLSNV